MIRCLALGVALSLASGCAGTIPPTYTQIELAKYCERTGGWWQPGNLLAGNCEFQNQGFQ